MELKRLGETVVSYFPAMRPLAQRTYRALPSILQSDVAGYLERRFWHRREVTFVQVGAFDGVTLDPINKLIVKSPNWRGVLIEPQPKAFERLSERYASLKQRIACLNCAIGDPCKGKTRSLYFIAEEDKRRFSVPEWADMLASFDRGHLEGHLKGIPISEISVDILSVSEVCSRARLEHASVIIIDAEGAEAEIIDGIEFDRLKTECLVFERIHLDDASRSKLYGQLGKLGFTLVELEMDTLARRRLER